jgi:hypothetical protein
MLPPTPSVLLPFYRWKNGSLGAKVALLQETELRRDPHLRGFLFLLTWQPQVGSECIAGSCCAGRSLGTTCPRRTKRLG